VALHSSRGERAVQQTDKERPVSTVTPHIVVRDAARAADWYRQALGATAGTRIGLPDGRFMQIELRFGDSVVMIADEFPELDVLSPLAVGGTYGTLHIATDDADALWQQAIAAGAVVHQPLQDTFWGERHGQIVDPFGHRWAIAQRLRDVPPEELAEAAAAAFGP
jgi:PhnB protein